MEETIKRFADGEAFKSQKRDSTGVIPRPAGQRKAPEKVLGESVDGVIVRLLPSQPNVAFAKVENRGDVLIAGNRNPKVPWPPIIGTRIQGKLVETMDRKKNRMGAKFIDAEVK